ncbi:MAG: hypothetical protein Q4P72_01155 [Eubacteriales bacterium]|nr:hypothetical protein [Eubacteriales bacterium]
MSKSQHTSQSSRRVGTTASTRSVRREKTKPRRWRRHRTLAICFVLLWTSLLVYVLLHQQANNLKLSFKNAELRSEILKNTEQNNNYNEELRRKTPLDQIAEYAKQMQLDHVKPYQKRRVPQAEVNRLVPNRIDANAEREDGKHDYDPMRQVFQNLEAYYRDLRAAETKQGN